MAKTPAKKANESEQQLEYNDDFAAEIAKRIDSLVSKETRGQVVAQMVSLVSESRYSGPIPHPRHLREYEDILPGSADRLISMAESQLEHSQKVQMRALESDVEDQKIGKKYGFQALITIVLAALAAGIFVDSILAAIFIGAGTLGIIGAFMRNRSQNNSS